MNTKKIFDEDGKLKTIKKPTTKNKELSVEEKKKIQRRKWRDESLEWPQDGGVAPQALAGPT